MSPEAVGFVVCGCGFVCRVNMNIQSYKDTAPPPPAQHWRLRDENEDNKGQSSIACDMTTCNKGELGLKFYVVYKEIHSFKTKIQISSFQFWKIAQEWTAISYNDYEMKFK